MGTKVDSKSYLPGFYSMRDLNEDSSSSSWPLCYGDKTVANGQYYNGFMARPAMDGYPGCGKDVLKHKMLEHEAVFKNQVYELHRLYRIQRDMMEEFRRIELHRGPMEPSSSSSLKGPQVPSWEKTHIWHMAGFPLLNSSYERTSISGVEITNSPNQFPFQNGSSVKDSQLLDSRPSKVRKKLFDLELPADECVDTEEGSSKSNLDSVNPGRRQENSHPLQHMLRPHDHPPGIYPTRHSREDIWGEGNHHSDKSLNQPNNSFFSSSYFSGTWAHAVSSWEKPTESFTQKLTSSDSRLNPTAAIDRSFHISAESRESYGGKCRAGDDFRLNPGFGSNLSTKSGFKELKVQSPLAGFDYLSCNRGDKLASDRTTNHGFGHFGKGSSVADSRPAIDINLNEKVSESSSNEVAILKNAATINEKGNPMDHLSTLPWLKNKPANDNGAANPSQFCCKTETVGDLNEPFTPKVTSTENSRNQSVKKILGFPIFETGDPKNEESSHVSTSASFSCTTDRNRADQKMKSMVIVINLECEPEEQIALEKEKQAKSASAGDLIDLNSCVTDCEETLAPSYESNTAKKVKVILDINLESPVLPDEDENSADDSSENRSDSSQEEALRTAAEAILAISSSSPKIHTVDRDIDLLATSLTESFLWFVNAVSSEEMDEFEAMTLQIPEMKEEDYAPTQFIPDIQKAEATSANTLTRPRRGQSRRGRPRKDFQRDILPGLMSLSRVEVAEDVQTFEGLMRATGHEWVPVVGRRNGCGRGRRRGPLMNEIEVGWGKTTRRPRCPAAGFETLNTFAGPGELYSRSSVGFGFGFEEELVAVLDEFEL